MIHNCTTYKILKVFFDNPTKKLGLKDVSLAASIAHTSVKKELDIFVSRGLMKKDIETKGKRKFPLYSASLNNEFKALKKLSNEYEIIKSGIVDCLKKELMPNSIIVFESFSRGEDVEESDIDIFIASEIREIDLTKFEKKLKKRINILFNSDINNLNLELKNNIVNGRILYGDIQLK